MQVHLQAQYSCPFFGLAQLAFDSTRTAMTLQAPSPAIEVHACRMILSFRDQGVGASKGAVHRIRP
jgi:hypothetical protein